MSPQGVISSVFALATLPRPIDAAHGRILAAPVTSLTPSKTRKRPEVAVSIDGEGVYIYSVENPLLLSSYAVPPQTYFIAPPCSVYQRTSRNNPARRFTYAAVQNRRNDSKTQLLCLEEKIQQADPKNPQRTHRALSSSSRVTSVHTLPSHNVAEDEPETHDVLILHEDGTANCLSSALGQSVWTNQLSVLTETVDGPISAEDYVVEYSELTDVGTAKKGLLKGREDVLALLQSGDAIAESVDSIQLLFVISGTSRTVENRTSPYSQTAHLYALRPRTSSSSPSLRSTPQHLLTWQIHRPRSQRTSAKSTFSLHAVTGALEELRGGSITTHDFSGISPRIASRLQIPGESLDSFVRLSSSLLLTVSSQQYATFDTKYNSILASLPIAQPAASIIKGKKRRISDVEVPSSTPEFIGCFSKAGISVALSGRDLIAVQISRNDTHSKRRKIRDTLLIDSIGRGTDYAGASKILHQSNGTQDMPSCLKKRSLFRERREDWPLQVEQLDNLLEEDKVPEFEALFATCLSIKTNFKKFMKDQTQRANGKGRIALQWEYPKSDAFKSWPVHREKALFALSRIFTVDRPANGVSALDSYTRQPSSIAVRFDAPNIFHWLANTGQLTAPLIQQALQQLHKTEHKVSHGDVIAAVVAFDPSLSSLHTIMDSPARLDIEEIAQAIKAIVQSLDDSTLPKPDPRLVANLPEDHGLTVVETLTNGASLVTNGDTPLTTGHIPEETYNDAATDAAMEELHDEINYAIETLESGLPIRGESLRHALSKLDSFPSKSTTQTLRRNLSQHEIVFLVHILRIELADGGWTSRYIDVGPELSLIESGEPSDSAISVIAKILGCAVDALGMSGWLVSSASDPVDSVDELLLSLRAEISATLEGVHEATFLTGVLSEFLRYPYKRVKAGWSAVPRRPNEGAGKALSQGRVWTVEKTEEPSLPIGLKVDERVGDTYVKSGGAVVQLNKREKGRAINMTVPKYSFEKIRI